MKRLLGLIVINIFLIIVMGISTPYFFTRNNLVVIIDNMALETIALSGYTLLLVGGHFDLSIDGIAALAGVVAGILMVAGMNWVLAVIFALTISGLIGALNGYVVAKLKVSGLIATLTTWWICIGISMGITKAMSPYGFPEAFQALGQSRILGFRSVVVFAVIVFIIMSVILHYTKTGAHIYASGDNPQSAEFMGINTSALGMKLYIMIGCLSGFIGLIVASRLNAASPIAVDGMALRVIAASVIGGSNLSGGEGSIIGGLLGLLMMHILGNAIIQFGVSPYWQKAVIGVILLSAVLSERIKLRRLR